MKQDNTPKKPFFARLLEAQRPEQDTQKMGFDKPDQTMKAPSDNDEW